MEAFVKVLKSLAGLGGKVCITGWRGGESSSTEFSLT